MHLRERGRGEDRKNAATVCTHCSNTMQNVYTNCSVLHFHNIIQTNHENSLLLPIPNPKAGSQCDARPCIVLICETQIFLIKNFNGDQTQGRNTKERKDATQRNARIGSESILALQCIAASVNAKATQRNMV